MTVGSFTSFPSSSQFILECFVEEQYFYGCWYKQVYVDIQILA